MQGVRSEEMRRLFLWHFAEEIEHKEVVFELLQRTSRSRLLRAAGLFGSWTTTSILRSRYFSAPDPRRPNRVH